MMERMCQLTGMSALLAGLLGVAGNAAAVPTYIAGTMPDRRPEGAPVIVDVAVSNSPKKLQGIDAPVPSSVENMLKDQGNWYTPFTRAGMVDFYDIRRYHKKE